MPTIQFDDALNQEQLAAATAPDGPALILAAAGTGKTRTLVYRVAHLVERGIDADRILLLTFTNKAAREMLDRAQHLIHGGVGGMWGGTFHHLANRMLRRHATALGYRLDYAILDRDDSLSLIRASIKALKLKAKEFPRAPVLMGLVGEAKNTQRAIADVVQDRYEQLETDKFTVDPEIVVRVLEAYESRKRGLGAMDFDDLLLNGLRLYKEHPDILARYQQQFQHVLVDEYQDTNPLQAQWVDLIGAGHRNVVVVGDDFQSIYSWRGADFRNIMSFPDRYADAAIYKLETNYRSTPEILKVANACIASNPDQFPKELRATRESHHRPVLARMRDGAEQARSVVARIRALRREGYRLSDIAVLYRAHYHAIELEHELASEQVPYVIMSGVRFFEKAHIKDVLCLVRLMVSADDELAFLRVMQLLPGVGEVTAQKAWTRMGESFALLDAAQRARLAEALPAAARAAWQDIARVFETVEHDPGDVIHEFVAAYYERYAFDAFEDYRQRLDDINELTIFMQRFETAASFLNDVALLTNLDAEAEAETDAAADGDQLRLSTVHQAKGLEWPVVIILWAADGLFPSSRSMNESPGGEAEERRLFYVAITRAKDELCICSPEVRRMQDGGVMYCLPSRFVEEIPPELLEVDRGGFV